MSTNTTGSLTNEQRIVYYDTVAAELARVTAERDDWKIRAEEMDGYKADCHALRVRVADLEIQRDMDTECIERIRSAGVKAEQRVAEMVRALGETPELVGLLKEAVEKLDRYANSLRLARAESGTPAKHPDTERLDWLAGTTNGVSFAFGSGKPIVSQGAAFPQFTGEDLRAAIDTARKQGGYHD